MAKKRMLVTGAGGFIGHHLVKYLKTKGYWVRGSDIKKPAYEPSVADEFALLDLRERSNALKATMRIDHVYNLAANMGGIGFIVAQPAEIMHDNILIDTNMLDAARENRVTRFFYSSSACVYPRYRQRGAKHRGLKEQDAYPADPDDEYGWEKLFTERLCINFYRRYGLETRIARFHNVYGPLGAWQGGREKSPAALCRKIAQAHNGSSIEVWGDGKQGRSYCYIDDCLEGIYRLMQSNVREPINIGSDRLVSINQLIAIISKIAGKKIKKKYDLKKPQGVRGRNSDNTLIKKILHWEPRTTLEEGLKKTYFWVKDQIEKSKHTSS